MSQKHKLNNEQRFLRRMYVHKHIDLILREIVYHRSHKDSEAISDEPLWTWGEDQGEVTVR